MKLHQKFLALSKGKQIASLVWIFHFLAIFSLIGEHTLSRRLKPHKPIVVRTVVPQSAPQPAKPLQTKSTTRTEKSSSPQSKKESGKKLAKAEAKPAALAPKEKFSISTATKKQPVQKDEALLKEIASQLEALQSVKSQPKPDLSIPQKVMAKPALEGALPHPDGKQALTTGKESSPVLKYGEFLIGYFQEALDLPEYGDVKAKIQIDRFGKLVECEILEAKSLKNAEFLKNQLPGLTFPCLNDFGILETAQTFTITFRNVETR